MSFNGEQTEYMVSLSKVPDNQRCWCGWDRLGNCTNPGCIKDKSLADKKAIWCPECRNVGPIHTITCKLANK